MKKEGNNKEQKFRNLKMEKIIERINEMNHSVKNQWKVTR
jgi:hypothetical protein